MTRSSSSFWLLPLLALCTKACSCQPPLRQGQSCTAGDGYCTDSTSALNCADGVLVRSTCDAGCSGGGVCNYTQSSAGVPCRGPIGCLSDASGNFHCDTTVASPGDKCRLRDEGSGTCGAMDPTLVLVCRSGTWSALKNCTAPAMCIRNNAGMVGCAGDQSLGLCFRPRPDGQIPILIGVYTPANDLHVEVGCPGAFGDGGMVGAACPTSNAPCRAFACPCPGGNTFAGLVCKANVCLDEAETCAATLGLLADAGQCP